MVHGNTGLTLIQDQDCHKVQEQETPLVAFGQGMYSNSHPSTVGENLRRLGKQVRDMVYIASLR